MYDAVVVGAGPAGAAAAKALCEAGRRVLLVERFRLPRYKSCSGILIKKSLGLVKQYFGEEVPSAVCCAPVENRGMIFTDDKGGEYAFRQEGRNVWRGAFDGWLVAKAAESGAELLDGTAAIACEEENGAVWVTLQNRERCKVRARYLLDCEGVTGALKRKLAPGPAQYITTFQTFNEGRIALDPHYFYAYLQPELSEYDAWFNVKDGFLVLGVSVRDAKRAEYFYRRFLSYMEERHGLCTGREERREKWLMPRIPPGCPIYYGQGRVLCAGEAAGFLNPMGEGVSAALESGHHAASALDAARVNGTDVVYAEGFPADRDETDEAKFAAAVEAARAADAAIIFAGLPDSFESEGYDRSHMRLPECQDRLIARVAAVQPNTVVVLHNGSPVECPWAESVNAVLEMYLGGQGVGAAADALLYGDANPSGRLPETFPYQLEDNPSHLNFPGDGKNVEYAEGVFVGYRYYDKKKMAVRWPFGHGLSYTTFEYSNVRVSADVLNDGGTVTVYADIKNTGDRAGREVVQLYVADRTGTAGRPEKELKGFAKVALEPGETKTVELSVDARSLSWYSEALGGWYAAPGRYELLVGHSSRDIRGAAAVEFRTEKLLPFHVDENTTVGELLADPRTASSVRQMARQFMDTIAPAAEDSADAAKEAVSDEMARQMMDNMPLRGLRSFGAFPEGALERMIADLNAKMAQ